MTPKDRIEYCKRFVAAWGESSQILLAVEEMAELIKALMKYHNRGNGNTGKIREEMADVKNMLLQLEVIFGNVDRELDEKLKRTAGLLYKKVTAEDIENSRKCKICGMEIKYNVYVITYKHIMDRPLCKNCFHWAFPKVRKGL